MKSIILAAVIIVVCRAVKVMVRRELKKFRDMNNNNLKRAVGV